MKDTHEELIKDGMSQIRTIRLSDEDDRIREIKIELVVTKIYWQGVKDGMTRIKSIYNP